MTRSGCYAAHVAHRPYHHGALRETLLQAALGAILETGATGWSLRDLARRAGVSHAAPAHHFGDKRGLLTALATEGYRRLAAELEEAWSDTASFLEVGVAYVRFATSNRSHFAVMYRPELLHTDDPLLLEARARSARPLFGPLEELAKDSPAWNTGDAAIAAWSLVHGLATLWLNGNLPPAVGADPEATVRRVAAYLFTPLPRPGVALTPPRGPR